MIITNSLWQIACETKFATGRLLLYNPEAMKLRKSKKLCCSISPGSNFIRFVDRYPNLVGYCIGFLP